MGNPCVLTLPNMTLGENRTDQRKGRKIMKFQVNIQITGIDSSVLTNADLKKALGLGKNEGIGVDLTSLTDAVAEALREKGAAVCHRSAKENLTCSIPLKVEGKLAKVDLTAPKASRKPKKTDAEKRAELLESLGL